jgi:hypothetical protein
MTIFHLVVSITGVIHITLVMIFRFCAIKRDVFKKDVSVPDASSDAPFFKIYNSRLLINIA